MAQRVDRGVVALVLQSHGELGEHRDAVFELNDVSDDQGASHGEVGAVSGTTMVHRPALPDNLGGAVLQKW